MILAPNTASGGGGGGKQPFAFMFVGCRYLAYGTSMDYMHAEMHVPYALTWEVGLLVVNSSSSNNQGLTVGVHGRNQQQVHVVAC